MKRRRSPVAVAVAGPPPIPVSPRRAETALKVNGRHVTPGTELSIRGVRGRFRFVEKVTTEAGAEWVTVYGGTKNEGAFRSFDPDRISTVHSVAKRRG
jgi:hypothetical protein